MPEVHHTQSLGKLMHKEHRDRSHMLLTKLAEVRKSGRSVPDHRVEAFRSPVLNGSHDFVDVDSLDLVNDPESERAQTIATAESLPAGRVPEDCQLC
jgi:hypothetical protein